MEKKKKIRREIDATLWRTKNKAERKEKKNEDGTKREREQER